MFRELLTSFHWKAGYRAASREIAELSAGLEADEEIFARRKHARIGRIREFAHPYTSGWEVRWQKLGATDARSGICQARRFRSHWYNMGWSNQILAFRNVGWQHRKLDAEWDLMRRRYWDRIKTGKSDDYYDIDLSLDS